VGLFEARKMRSEHFAFTFVPLCFVEWFGICFFGGEVFDLLMGLKFRVFLDFMELWGVCEGGVVGLFVFTENAESTFPFHILVSLVRGTVREYDSFFQVRSYFLKSERFGSFVLKPELWNCLNCEFFLNRRFLGILRSRKSVGFANFHLLPSFLPSFLLPSFLPLPFPSFFLPSFLSSLPPSFLPFFLPFFLPSFLPTYLLPTNKNY
jgi:hypothetical protein